MVPVHEHDGLAKTGRIGLPKHQKKQVVLLLTFAREKTSTRRLIIVSTSTSEDRSRLAGIYVFVMFCLSAPACHRALTNGHGAS